MLICREKALQKWRSLSQAGERDGSKSEVDLDYGVLVLEAIPVGQREGAGGGSFLLN